MIALSRRGENISNVRNTIALIPQFVLPYKKATTPPNVLSYIVFNLKAPLFKGGWGGSDAMKQPTFPLTL